MGISIVIPFRNAEKTIQRCVNSILHQNIDDLQIILVNDHSSDDSCKICRDLSNDRRVILVNTNNSGVSSARNVGLQYASKEIIGFCDADDFLEDNVLNSILQEFTDQNIDMLITGYYKTFINNQGCTQIEPMHLKKCKKITAYQASKLVLTDDHVMGSVWNKFYRKALINNIYFYEDLSYCEDMHFNCQVLNKLSENDIRKPIKILSYCTYHYVQNPGSVTNTWNTLFDENNNLKYIVSMNAIENIKYISKDYIRYKKFVFALDYLTRPQIMSLKQRKKLLEIIKKNIIYFVLCFFCFPRKNVRLIFQWLRSIFNNYN